MDKKHKPIDYARSYLKAGASVIPLGKDKKALFPWAEYQQRHPTEQEVTEWWTKWPEANIGIVTGKISGLIVVDCDLGSDHTKYPETDTIRTGSGGHHLYYAYHPISNKAGIHPHVDIRGDGGYAVAPPSITSDVIQDGKLIKKGGEYIIVKKVGRKPFPAHLFGEQKKSRMQEIMQGVSPSGQRNTDATSVAGKLMARFPEREWRTEAWPMLVAWNSTHANPPLPERELFTIFMSVASAEKTKRVKGSVGELGVEILEDVVRVTLPIDGGFGVFSFDDFNFSARSQECTLVCHLETQEGITRSLTSRINLLSMSQKTEFLRQFKDSFGIEKKSAWPAIISEIFTRVAQARVTQYKAERLKDIKIEPWSYLLEPFIVKNAPNALFAKGGSGKTFMAIRFGLSVAFGVPLPSCPVPMERTNVLFFDFEDDGGEFKDRVTKLAKGLPPEIARPTDDELNDRLFYFDSKGLPFANLVAPLKKAIAENNIGLIIVDSAAKACGGSAESSEDTNAFFNSLRSVGITSLIIAHESKNALEDNDDIFGSSFWNNSFRNVWKIKTEREKDADFINIALIHCKSNRGKLQKTRAYRVLFGNDFVEVNHTEVAEVFSRELPMETQITNAIFHEHRTAKAIAEYIGTNPSQVRATASRLAAKKAIMRDPRSGKETEWILPHEIKTNQYKDA